MAACKSITVDSMCFSMTLRSVMSVYVETTAVTVPSGPGTGAQRPGRRPSVEVTGDIVGVGDVSSQKLTGVKLTLSLAGNSPVDINRTVISYRTPDAYNDSVFDGTNWTDQVAWVRPGGTTGGLLDNGNQVRLYVLFVQDGERVGANSRLDLEIKPPGGAVLPVSVTTPSYINATMILAWTT